MEKEKHLKKLTGEVVSNKMLKTVVVKVTSKHAHPKYGKIITTTKRYKAHTEETIEEGKMVVIESCRKLSKDKSFKVIKVLD
ncbi:MAG: 30S ribosomal protein S17 [bacterium]